MGHFSDFFAANADELRTDFPYRHVVMKELQDIEAVNPFNGKTRKVRTWVPLESVPDPPLGVSFPTQTEMAAFRRLRHVECNRLDHIVLSRLQEIFGLREYTDGISELDRLELVTPGAEDMMFVLPVDFVDALANIRDLADISARWCETGEMQKQIRWSINDTVEVLGSVQGLARYAIESNRNVLFWIHGY